MTIKDLMQELGIGRPSATRIIHEVRDEMVEEGYKVATYRPLTVPRQRVMDKLGLSERKRK